MNTIAQRNAEGVVTMNGDAGQTISITIPQTRSMLGILSINSMVDGGEYKEDGWVYHKGKPVRKWHSTFDNIRIWEPKLNNLPELYRLYKLTQKSFDEQWKRISEVIEEIWAWGPRTHNEVIAHALPTHHFEWNKNTKPWWQYKIRKDVGSLKGLSFSFDWIDEGRPKPLVNYPLGQKLYDLERRSNESLGKRFHKTQTIFYQAMKRSLPKATENKVISLQFGKDSYWFRTVTNNNSTFWWEMFKDSYSFEIRKII